MINSDSMNSSFLIVCVCVCLAPANIENTDNSMNNDG